MEKAIQIVVSGKVQGVFFRKNTYQKAGELGLKGFVSNQKDGTVKIIAQGDKMKLKALVEWCYQGPPNSIVEKVDVIELTTLHQYEKFEIHYL
ncbi:MAG: acylphosphatase [Bacteroidota bacterium]|nr:acylphosphatase [Bacteroidota bacterium]